MSEQVEAKPETRCQSNAEFAAQMRRKILNLAAMRDFYGLCSADYFSCQVFDAHAKEVVILPDSIADLTRRHVIGELSREIDRLEFFLEKLPADDRKEEG